MAPKHRDKIRNGAADRRTVDAAIAVKAQQLQPVSVIVFPGGFNWPIWIAQEKGYFAKDGIEVKLTNTPNSVFQLTNLIDGKFDIAMTAIDNVIAYMEGQGEAQTASKPDLVVFMGGDNGFLSLVTVPEVKTYADLKGRTVSVDALTTGYAFVLLDMLKRNGLAQGDYKVEKAGGVMARWEAIKEKKHDGTMLITPFDIFAKSQRTERAAIRNRSVRELPGTGRRLTASLGRRESEARRTPISAARSRVSTSCSIRPTRTRPLRSCARICRRCPSQWRRRVTR